MSTLQQAAHVEFHRCPTRGVIVTRGTDGIVWEGIDRFERFLKETPGVVRSDVEAGLFQEGENIMGVSKQRTPVAPGGGKLRSSGHVKLPVTKRGKTVVTLAYGTEYALPVHETPSKHDPPSWVGKTVKFNVGGPKFLESAMKDASKGFGGRLKRRVLDRIRRR